MPPMPVFWTSCSSTSPAFAMCLKGSDASYRSSGIQLKNTVSISFKYRCRNEKIMANQLVRDKIKAYINAAISEAQSAAEIDHPGMMGTIREIAIKNLFEPLLTGQTNIGSGKIIDFTGFQSQETDVIIYSKNIHPAILYSHRKHR